MKRKPSPPAKDIRAPWQIAQAVACPCRGSDDYCACQNVDQSDPAQRYPSRADLEQRIRELEGAVRTLELQQQTDRQTIASLLAARPAVVSDEVVERMKKLSERLMQMAQDRQDWADHPEIGGKKPMLNSHLRGKRYGYSHAAQLIDAALALLPGGMVPDGYVLVPREPTEAMVKSGQRAADDKYWLWRGLGERPVGSGLDGMALYVDAAYRAMLSASPKEVSQ